MIDISFLTPRQNLGGLEFMDFQNGNLFKELTEVFENHINKGILSGACEEYLKPIIFKHTGFNIGIEISGEGNLCIDAGYINPNNVFNISGIEDYLAKSESTIGQWFKHSQNKVFKGEIDYSTGRVSGAYSELPLTVRINKDIDAFISLKDLAKLKGTSAEALAATLIHELGHAFGGVMMIHQSVKDNIIINAAIKALTNDKYTQDKVTVYRDTFALLELDGNPKDADSLKTEQEFILYFSKMVGNRNAKRALSLGVPQMSSEVIADAYSVRMGCGKALLVGMSALFIRSRESGNRAALIMAGVMALYFLAGTGGIAIGAMLPVFVIFFGIIKLLMWFGGNTSGDYNTDYRRLMNIYQEMILKLKVDKNLSPADKKKLVNEIDMCIALTDSQKPFFEGTVIQRIAGYITDGRDFKYKDIEHYTQSLANHKVNTLSSKFE